MSQEKAISNLLKVSLLKFQMGNQIFTSNADDRLKSLQHYNITERNQETGILYMVNRQSGNQCIMRQLTTSSENQIETINLIASKKILHNSKFLLRLIEKIGVKDSSYCSNQFKFYLIFERPYKTLRSDIHERKFNNNPFQQEQLIRILRTSLSALRYLKQIGQTHENISSNNIFKNKGGGYCISDPWLNFQPQVSPSINHLYHSPEKLELRKNVTYQKINQYASDLFSLGMVLLEAIQLDYMDDAYGRRQINYEFLADKLNHIEYPKIKNYLEGLLSCKPKRRMSMAHQIQAFSFGSHRQTLQFLGINKNSHQDFNQSIEKQKQFKIKAPGQKNYQKQQTLPDHYESLPTQRTQKQQQGQKINKVVQKNQKLQDTHALSETGVTKYPKCNLFSQEINILIQSKIIIVNQQDSKEQDKSIFSHEQYIKVQENISSSKSIHSEKQQPETQLQGYDGTQNQKMKIKEEEPQYHLLVYDYESIVDQSLKTQKLNENLKQEKQGGASSQNTNLQLKDDQTPPKKNIKQRRHNSTIMQVSDSENQSCQQQPEFEYVIQKYQVGSKYEGYKKNGMRNGRGKFSYHDGGYYEGYWKDDKMNGQGKLYYASGKLAYQGQWREDEFYGHGKVFNDNITQKQEINYKNFNTLEQQWEYYQGNLISDTKQGYGKIMFSNGQVFQGQFINDKMSGNGKFFRKDGVVIKGLWKGSKLVVTL